MSEPYDTEDMSKNILRVLENEEKMGENARTEAEKKYCDIVIAKKYLALYGEMVKNMGTNGRLAAPFSLVMV